MPVNALTRMFVNATSVATCGPWIVLDQFETPFNVGFGLNLVSGGPSSSKVQHTFANVLNANVSADFIGVFDNYDVTAAVTAADGNYAFPVSAIRLVVNSMTSSGTVQLQVRQAGS